MKQFKNMLAKFADKLRKTSDKSAVINKRDLVLSLNSKRTPRKPQESDESEIQKILAQIAKDAEFLNLIKQKPESLMERFDLSKADIIALRAADLLIAARLVNPLLQQSDGGTAATIYFPDGTITGNIPDTGVSTITTDTGSTCTVTNNGPIVSIASTVESLKDMDSVHLAGLIQRLVEDEEFYNQTRNYFGL